MSKLFDDSEFIKISSLEPAINNNKTTLTEHQKRFYNERYTRRQVQKFFEVRIKKKIIYIDNDVTLTKTRKRQVERLVNDFKYTALPTPQTKIFKN